MYMYINDLMALDSPIKTITGVATGFQTRSLTADRRRTAVSSLFAQRNTTTINASGQQRTSTIRLK